MRDHPLAEAYTYTKHTHTHNRRTTMLSAGFEHAILEISRLQNYALDPTATGIGDEII